MNQPVSQTVAFRQLKAWTAESLRTRSNVCAFLSVGLHGVFGMSGVGGLEGVGPPSADPLTVHLDEILDSFAAAVADTTAVGDASRIDRIARLEKLSCHGGVAGGRIGSLCAVAGG